MVNQWNADNYLVVSYRLLQRNIPIVVYFQPPTGWTLLNSF